MTTGKSTTLTPPLTPSGKAKMLDKARAYKRREGVPLTVHPSGAAGRWCKKVGGVQCYFGPIDPDVPDFGAAAALTAYRAERDDLAAGRPPRKPIDAATVGDVANAYLNSKRADMAGGELSPRSFRDYYHTCRAVVTAFGRDRLVTDLGPEDFAAFRATLAKTRGPVSLANAIQRVRMVFQYGHDEGLSHVPLYGRQSFKKPSRKTIRLARAARGPRMFEADELRRIIGAAGQPLRAMVRLGLNTGMGQSDIAALPRSALNLETGWMDYPRVKTGIPRRCPLWPETVEAVRDAMRSRPKPKDPADADLVFLTAQGRRWVRVKLSGKAKAKEDGRMVNCDAVAAQLRKVLDKLGINGQRNFYALRHTFETVGGETKDQVAVDAIMGHSRDDMASLYRERVGDDRLLAVTEHVRKWTFGDSAPT